MVVHHVDDPARGVQRRGGRQSDAEVTGVEPEPAVWGGGGLDLDHILLHRKLRLRNAFGAACNYPPLTETHRRHLKRASG